MDKLEIFVNNLSEEDKEKLIALIAKASQSKSKVYKPENGETYFSLAGTKVEDFIFVDDEYDRLAYLIGNCFKTKEEADFMVEKLKVTAELKRFAEEHNKGEIRFGDSGHMHYRITYNVCFKFIDVVCGYRYKDNTIYFSSSSIAKEAIEAIGVDRLKKYYFGVTE